MDGGQFRLLVSASRKTYMRHRWIPPLDLYEGLMWRNKQQAMSEHPGDSAKAEIRSVRESVGNGHRNPLLITKDCLIQGWISPEVEEQMGDREGYGCTWLNGAVYLQYRRIRGEKDQGNIYRYLFIR